MIDLDVGVDGVQHHHSLLEGRIRHAPQRAAIFKCVMGGEIVTENWCQS